MTKPVPKGHRFTRIELENWRNFTSVDARLGRRVFLVGPNASGKSNLLDAFKFLRDVVSVGGGFQEAVRRRGGVSKIRSLYARRQPDIRLRITVGTEDVPTEWQYELAFGQDRGGPPQIRRERVVESGRVLHERPDKQDRTDERRLMQTHLEQLAANQAYRDLVDFLASVQYLHVVPQLVREPDRSVGRSDDPFGGDFLERLAEVHTNTRRARLRRIRDALRVAVPQLRELKWERDQHGTAHLYGNYQHWRPSGAWQTEDQFSDGTLRLVGLLWSLLDSRGPLLLEEPELSLHPGVVRHLPSMFARTQRTTRRQIMVSSHSPELLMDEGIGLDEVFLLQPSTDGTEVHAAGATSEVRLLLQGGVPLSDVVLSRTQPADAYQLALFGE